MFAVRGRRYFQSGTITEKGPRRGLEGCDAPRLEKPNERRTFSSILAVPSRDTSHRRVAARRSVEQSSGEKR